MSRKQDRQPPRQEPSPDCPAPYCDTYRYVVDSHGIVTLWFSRFGKWHAGVAMPISTAIDMHQKLGPSIADVLRRQAQTAAPTTEEPKP